MLREEGIDGVGYALWDATAWHRDYSPPAWNSNTHRDALPQLKAILKDVLYP